MIRLQPVAMLTPNSAFVYQPSRLRPVEDFSEPDRLPDSVFAEAWLCWDCGREFAGWEDIPHPLEYVGWQLGVGQ